MSTITFQLRGTRTEADVYKDTALKHGWEATVEQTEKAIETDIPDTWVAPTGATNLQRFTTDTGVNVSYNMVSMVPNPVTQFDFGKKLVHGAFGLQDAELAGEAETIRAKADYNV